MKRIIFCVILFVGVAITKANAMETYCSITFNAETNEVCINPNEDYLTPSYWHCILYDREGNKRKFSKMDDAINHLARFNWYVSRYENVSNMLIVCVMAHKVNSYMELKSSRENMLNYFDVFNSF